MRDRLDVAAYALSALALALYARAWRRWLRRARLRYGLAA